MRPALPGPPVHANECVEQHEPTQPATPPATSQEPISPVHAREHAQVQAGNDAGEVAVHPHKGAGVQVVGGGPVGGDLGGAAKVGSWARAGQAFGWAWVLQVQGSWRRGGLRGKRHARQYGWARQ